MNRASLMRQNVRYAANVDSHGANRLAGLLTPLSQATALVAGAGNESAIRADADDGCAA